MLGFSIKRRTFDKMIKTTVSSDWEFWAISHKKPNYGTIRILRLFRIRNRTSKNARWRTFLKFVHPMNCRKDIRLVSIYTKILETLQSSYLRWMKYILRTKKSADMLISYNSLRGRTLECRKSRIFQQFWTLHP